MAITSRTRGRTGGSSVFGSIPDPIKLPNVLGDLRAAVPNYNDITSLLSSNLLSGLQGQLTPDLSASVLDAANARAMMGGLGGSQFANNIGLRDLGLTSKAIQDQAFSQALPFLANQSRTATLDPSIQASIGQYNSLLDAMPDPTARANWLLEQQKLNNPAKPQLPFGSGSTAIPSGGMPNLNRPFTPAVNWGNKMSLGVQPYNPSFSGSGQTTRDSWNILQTPQLFGFSTPKAAGNAGSLAAESLGVPSTGGTSIPAPMGAQGTSPNPLTFSSFTQQAEGINPNGWWNDVADLFSENIYGGPSSRSTLESSGINVNDILAPF